jgi:hypothetical protein
MVEPFSIKDLIVFRAVVSEVHALVLAEHEEQRVERASVQRAIELGVPGNAPYLRFTIRDNYGLV